MAIRVIRPPSPSEYKRVCEDCAGWILKSERRCPCKAKPSYDKPFYPPDLTRAHFRALITSIRSGSWARTGYRSPYNAEKTSLALVYQDLEGSFRITRASRIAFTNFKNIQFFVLRCELAATYWRDEFASLMGTRMTLWLGGCKQQKVGDFLQLPLDKVRWLDGVIRKEFGINFPPRNRLQHADFLETRRRMKAGVAADIIRRRQKGYKQSQALQPQQVNPFV